MLKTPTILLKLTYEFETENMTNHTYLM